MLSQTRGILPATALSAVVILLVVPAGPGAFGYWWRSGWGWRR